jgi:hypothetical protein
VFERILAAPRPVTAIAAGLPVSLAHLIAHDPADADPARLSQGLKPGRDVDAVAVDVVVIDDDVAEVEPNSKFDAPLRRHLDIPLRHAALDFDRAAHCVDNAGELHKDAVAGELDDAASVLLDFGVDELAPMPL